MADGFPQGGSAGPPAASVFAPGNPAATIVASPGVMMGLGSTVKFTPIKTGKLLLMCQTFVSSNTAGTNPAWQVAYGTGGAPANGVAATGTATAIGGAASIINANTFEAATGIGIISGLTVNTQYWFDAQLISNGVASVSITGLLWSIMEVS